MTIDQIKRIVDAGGKVYCSHSGYQVKKASDGWYYIHCTMNGSCIGLTDVSETILNGQPEEFFCEEGQ